MKKLVCCLVLFIAVLFCTVLLVQPDSAFAAQPQESAVLTANVCPEGQYLDLATNYCRNLDKSFGFDANAFSQAFNQRQFTVNTCSESALRAAVDQAKQAGGGTVQVPACTIEIGKPLLLPGNTIFTGAGRGKTVIKATSGLTDGNMVNVKYSRNIIIRDMRIDGSGKAARALMLRNGDNLLVERVEAHNNDSSGIVFRYTQNITIRYVESHHNNVNHGIGSKDCFDETLDGCKESAGDVSPGVLWSEDYAIYSNNLHHNGKYGLDSHALYGEIAGNLLNENGYGSKFPDASYVWIHHNQFKNNDGKGTHIYSTLKIPEQYPQNLVFYQNEFSSNGAYPLLAAAPSKNVYMIDNSYQNNDPNKLRIDDVTVYVCNATADAALEVNGNDPKTASAAQCDLSSVAHLFGQDNDTPDDIIPEVPAPVEPTETPAPGTVQLPNPTPVPTATPVPGEDPFREGAVNVPGRIEAEDYQPGGDGVGYHDTTDDNEGETYRDDDVDIQETSDSDGKYNVGWIEEGEWLAYDLEVAQAGTYELTARVRTWNEDLRWITIDVNGQTAIDSAEFVRPPTGENWYSVVLGSVQLAAGQNTMQVMLEGGGFNLNYIDAVLTAAAETPDGNPSETPGDNSNNPGDETGGDPDNNPGNNPGSTPGGSLPNVIYLPVINQ